MGAKHIAKNMERKDLLTSHGIIVCVAWTPVRLYQILQVVKGLMCMNVLKMQVIAYIFQTDVIAHKHCYSKNHYFVFIFHSLTFSMIYPKQNTNIRCKFPSKCTNIETKRKKPIEMDDSLSNENLRPDT